MNDDFDLDFGPWDEEPEYYGDACPFCGKLAWYVGMEFVECKECRKKAIDLPAPKRVDVPGSEK